MPNLLELIDLFVDNLLPILLIAGAGYALGTLTPIDSRSLSQVTFNIFSPCLLFTVIASSGLARADMGRMVILAAATMLCIGGLAWLAGGVLRLTRPMRAALVLTAMLPNAGNYGLSLNMLAFGQQAVAHAGMYFVTSSVFTFTIGVLVASLGSANLRTALLGLLRVPAVYAAALAVVMMQQGWVLPAPLDRTVSLVADAAIPAFLVVLGLQLRRVQSLRPSRALGAAAALRMLGSPALALLLVPVLGMAGPARQAAWLQAAMPTAVATTVLAENYDLEPEFITSVVFLTTVLSPLTLTPLLAWLGAGQ